MVPGCNEKTDKATALAKAVKFMKYLLSKVDVTDLGDYTEEYNNHEEGDSNPNANASIQSNVKRENNSGL